MSIISPEFTFAEYWSYALLEGGGLGAPFPPRAESLLSLDGKFIYAFGETSGARAPFELVELFFIRHPAAALFPSIHTVPPQSAAELTERDMSPAVDVVTLPTTASGGVDDRKYFFIAVPRLLEALTRFVHGSEATEIIEDHVDAGPHREDDVVVPAGRSRLAISIHRADPK